MLLGLIPTEAKFFTCLDFKDIFFCICLFPQSQPIFAFQWESSSTGKKGQLSWTWLPQGYKNSPIIFGTALASALASALSWAAWLHTLPVCRWPSIRWTNSGGLYGRNFYGRQDIWFPKRKLRFARTLSNTSGFTCHKDNLDWALRGNRSSVPFQPPRPIDRLENF
jgi:hypothetical protein